MRSKATRLSLFIALVLLCAAFVATHFQSRDDITAFLPQRGDPRFQLSQKLLQSRLSRTMILTISADGENEAAKISRAFEDALAQQAPFQQQALSVNAGPPPDFERALWELIHPRRFGYLADDAQGARQRLSPEGLRAAAESLKQQLAQPTSTLVSRNATSDPFLTMLRLFETFQRSRADELRVHEGRFITQDGRFAVLFLESKASAFDAKAQRPILEAVDAAFLPVQARFPSSRLQSSGVNRFTVSAERSIRSDIRRISIASILGLSLLLIALFRSLRLLALASLPVGVGMLAGCTTTLFVYGDIHGITLAFGASLLGVTFDYVAHIYCHYILDHEHQSSPVRHSITLGASTTLLGFALLAFSDFRGLQEVALFSLAGIFAAAVVTLEILPLLLPPKAKTRSEHRIADGLASILSTGRRRPYLWWTLVLATLAAAAFSLPSVQWNKSFADLGNIDAKLMQEEQIVRSRVSHDEQMHFVVARGPSYEAALQVQDKVQARLRAQKQAKNLRGVRNLSFLLPSAQTQAQVRDVLYKDTELPTKFRHAFSQAGFDVQKFAPFFEALKAPPPPALSYEMLMQTPLAPLIAPFAVKLGDEVGLVNFLSGVSDPKALHREISAIPGATYLDQGSLLAQSNRDMQRRVAILLTLGVANIMLLLVIRYRSLRFALAAIAPALLGALACLSVLALCGRALDLISLTCLLIIFSMGVDYGIFLSDAARKDQQNLRAAALSIAVAGLSTLFGFLLLALSSYPILQTIGLTAGVGILACLLFAPLSPLLVGADPKRS